ncbi:TetR/AcrR family transcriptional regulator [Fulvivirgaceae bacterium BMA10]|uniref:TetR/AcrR family transcriptional regulator n=1 Tax=Splendidivirga corallicola TaxID=3051826 RepID=A0ABT8KLZ6_9BACT|nr:TetR/AcrR family transcriptional regulator [Fulvivirgaceae bacterium BMA10]
MGKAQETRHFIIQKVAPIFNKKGYAGTSLSDLTTATGLTKGSIYGNFKDKNEVAIEAFRYNCGQLTSEIRTLINQTEDCVQKLLIFLAFYKTNFYRVFKNGGCAMLNTAVDADDTHPALKEEVVGAIESWKGKVESILKKGMENNEIIKVDVERFSSKMLAMIEGSIMLSKTTGKINYLLYNLEDLETEIKKLKK